MIYETLSKVIETAPGARKDGAAFLLPDETEATLFVALGQEMMTIARVARVEKVADLVALATHKGERFFFTPEQIVGLRFSAAEASKPSRPHAGFR